MCMVSFTRIKSYSSLEKMKHFNGVPTWAYVAITDRCSHKCSWCYGGFDGDLKDQMSIETFRIVADKAKRLGIVQMTLTGGEPTEHPDFREFVTISNEMGFVVHVCSHGEHIDAELAQFMAANGVRQVQLNFQGKKRHDQVHGIKGSYDKQITAINHLRAAGIGEVTTTFTIGAYNIKDMPDLFDEASALGVERLRVWETTGRGKPWLRDKEAVEIFTAAEKTARERGYNDVLSYDPEYPAQREIACPQLANVFMYITAQAKVRFCCAVPGGKELEIIDVVKHEPEEILKAYLAYNKRVQGNRKPWCVARLGFDPIIQEAPLLEQLPV